jgi:hypothetical protein
MPGGVGNLEDTNSHVVTRLDEVAQIFTDLTSIKEARKWLDEALNQTSSDMVPLCTPYKRYARDVNQLHR